MGLLSRLFSRPSTKGFAFNGAGRIVYLGGVPFYDPEGGDTGANSAVMAAARFISRSFPEAPLELWRPDADGNLQIVRESNAAPEARFALALLRRPHPQMAARVMWGAAGSALAIEGNAYLRIVRAASGRPAELQYLPPALVTPKSDAAGYLSHYLVKVAGREERVEADEIVHVRDGVDPSDPLLGLSPLLSVAREVMADNEASVYIHSVLRNPTLGLMISPRGDVEVPEAEAQALVEKLKQTAGGASRFSPIVPSVGLDVKEFGIAPDKMPLAATRAGAVERICAVLGLDPMVLGLPSQNKTYSNYEEAREAAYEGLIIPLQALFTDEFNHKILAQFPSLEEQGYRIDFDHSKVRVLQGDEDALWERVTTAYQRGVITRGIAKVLLGQDPAPEDEVYATDMRLMSAASENVAEKHLSIRSMRDRARSARESLEEIQAAQRPV
jgi:HK97 family phage portal protein